MNERALWRREVHLAASSLLSVSPSNFQDLHRCCHLYLWSTTDGRAASALHTQTLVSFWNENRWFPFIVLPPLRSTWKTRAGNNDGCTKSEAAAPPPTSTGKTLRNNWIYLAAKVSGFSAIQFQNLMVINPDEICVLSLILLNDKQLSGVGDVTVA